MKITLASVKYSPSLSEETNAFTAIVCIDGVPAFNVSNHGTGGCDEHYPLKGQDYQQMGEQMKRVNEYAKTLPPMEFHGTSLPYDLDLLVGDAFEEWLSANDLKKHLKAKILFTKADGALYQLKRQKTWTPEIEVRAKEQIKARGALVILNDIPFEEALVIWKKNAA